MNRDKMCIGTLQYEGKTYDFEGFLPDSAYLPAYYFAVFNFENLYAFEIRDVTNEDLRDPLHQFLVANIVKMLKTATPRLKDSDYVLIDLDNMVSTVKELFKVDFTLHVHRPSMDTNYLNAPMHKGYVFYQSYMLPITEIVKQSYATSLFYHDIQLLSFKPSDVAEEGDKASSDLIKVYNECKNQNKDNRDVVVILDEDFLKANYATSVMVF